MKFTKVLGLMVVLLSCDSFTAEEFATEQEYSHTWKSREDARNFMSNICKLGEDSPDTLAIIERTVDSLREEPWYIARG